LLTRRIDGALLACRPADDLATVPDVVRIAGTAEVVFDEFHIGSSMSRAIAHVAARFDADTDLVAADVAIVVQGWLAAGLIVETS
jgi:hypothetical protein